MAITTRELETFITGAEIAGVNGMHFGPDGYLYAASVIGSDITVIDTEHKNIVKRYGLSEGVIGPDDVAFNSKGGVFGHQYLLERSQALIVMERRL